MPRNCGGAGEGGGGDREGTMTTVAKFIAPDWEDKVDSGIGLSYRLAMLHRLAGRYDIPMPELTLSPQSETMNLATVLPSQ